MKRILALIIVLTMVFCLCGTASADASEDKEVTLSVASFLGSGNPAEPILNITFNMLYEKSGGTIKCEYFGNSTLLGQSDMIDGVKAGIADVGFLQFGDYPGMFPEMSMPEYPGIYFASGPAITNAYKDYYETYKPAELDGIHILTFECGTLGGIFSNKGPIHHPSDLEGQTIRSLGNMAKCVSAFGGVPVDVSIADCYESLRTGVLDGIMTINGALEGFKLSEVIDYGMNYPLYNHGNIWFMNEDVYNSLSENQQRAVDETFDALFDCLYSPYINDLFQFSRVGEAINEVDSHGEYYWPTEEEIGEFQVLIEGIVQEYADSIDNGQEILDRWTALAEKWNEVYPHKDVREDAYIMTYPDTGERFSSDNHVWQLDY